MENFVEMKKHIVIMMINYLKMIFPANNVKASRKKQKRRKYEKSAYSLTLHTLFLFFPVLERKKE